MPLQILKSLSSVSSDFGLSDADLEDLQANAIELQDAFVQDFPSQKQLSPVGSPLQDALQQKHLFTHKSQQTMDALLRSGDISSSAMAEAMSAMQIDGEMTNQAAQLLVNASQRGDIQRINAILRVFDGSPRASEPVSSLLDSRIDNPAGAPEPLWRLLFAVLLAAENDADKHLDIKRLLSEYGHTLLLATIPLQRTVAALTTPDTQAGHDAFDMVCALLNRHDQLLLALEQGSILANAAPYPDYLYSALKSVPKEYWLHLVASNKGEALGKMLENGQPETILQHILDPNSVGSDRDVLRKLMLNNAAAVINARNRNPALRPWIDRAQQTINVA